MSRMMQALRSRQQHNRTQRMVSRAIAEATTPAMRDELIVMAQRMNSSDR